MSSGRTPLSASRRAAPIKVHVLNFTDRDNFPYTNVESRWSFTMNLMPLTRIKELCIHAAGQVQRAFNAVVDGTQMEARDRDGHLFHGQETISEEILSGETIFLIEGGCGASESKATEDTGKEMGKGKDMGRLLSLRTEAEKAYRTPSVSSRSSSQSRKKARSQPKMTPSQRLLAIAQSKLTPKSEPWRARSSSFSAAGRQNSPFPLELPHPKSASAREELSEIADDASSGVGTEATEPRHEIFVDRSQKDSRSIETSPDLQDSQQVVPDSQDPPSGSLLPSPPPATRAVAVSMDRPKSNAPEPSPAQPRPAPRLDTIDAGPLHNIPPATTTSTSRPDPYDISTVLLDDEDHSPKRPSTIMSSPARKLGGAVDRRRAPASLPPMRQPQLNTASPSRASKSAMTDGNDKARGMNFARPTTPARKSPTPIQAEVSSPAAMLPSSPTNNVAAAIARGRARVQRKPIPESIVIEESADEIDEELFHIPPGLSAPVAPSLEAALPWSQPPLRATQDPTVGLRTTTRRDPAPGVLGAAAENDNPTGEADVIDVTAHVRRMIDEAKETLAAAASDNGKLTAKALTSSGISPFDLSSPLKSFPKTAPPSPASRKPGEQAKKIHPTVTIIRGSSSEIGSIASDEDVPVIKEEKSDDDNWKSLPAAVFPSSPSPEDHGVKGKDVKVIELSSDSDSSIDLAWVEDFETELPVNEAPLPLDAAPRDIELPAPVIPAPGLNKWETDPIEPKVNDEPPPSAQPDKRKRSISDEPDSEDEREKKRARRVEKKKARRALRRARHQEKILRLEEERKRLALEQARRRALELEIIVSSPTRARQLGANHAEVDEIDDDSGPEPCLLNEMLEEDIGVPLDGDDGHDSSFRAETEDRQPWERSTKARVFVTPEKIQDAPSLCIDNAHSVSPNAPHTRRQEQGSQNADALEAAGARYHRKPFDDWAALEATLGCGSLGYSSLEVHNRVHLAMVHSGLKAVREKQADLGASIGVTVKFEPEDDDTKEELPAINISGDVRPPTAHSQHVIKFEPEEDDIKEEVSIVDTSGDETSRLGHSQHIVKAEQREKKTNKEKCIDSSSKALSKSTTSVQESPRPIRSKCSLPPQSALKKYWKKGDKDMERKKGKTSERRRQRDRDRRKRHEMKRGHQYYFERRDSLNAKKKKRTVRQGTSPERKEKQTVSEGTAPEWERSTISSS